MQPQSLAWCDPLILANSLEAGDMALLYSGSRTSYSGRYSLLAEGLAESVDLTDFAELDRILRRDSSRFAHGWFGYLGYQMRHGAESYTTSKPSQFSLPPGKLMRFARVYVFDHEAGTLTLWSEQPHPLPELRNVPEVAAPSVVRISSNMTRKEYEKKVAVILDEIDKGSLYQANLTRKFFGNFKDTPDGFALFRRLCTISPAPYSAYLRIGGVEVLSSSPELFLKIDAAGRITSRPIKGSTPRGATPEQDAVQKRALEESAKNRAENLMITDLMRSDLSKQCVSGSIQVSGLFDVTEHATIFHMASTIAGELLPNARRGEVVKAAFPPGSMTGAPKIRAVELCNALEGDERGLYSGAIGWFGGDGSAELSVVIRTLILEGDRFEFQVGGGIVADSTPEGEWRETIDKTIGIIKTLDISRQTLESL